MIDPLATTELCWNCEGNHFIAGGHDEDGSPITICSGCHEVQW